MNKVPKGGSPRKATMACVCTNAMDHRIAQRCENEKHPWIYTVDVDVDRWTWHFFSPKYTAQRPRVLFSFSFLWLVSEKAVSLQGAISQNIKFREQYVDNAQSHLWSLFNRDLTWPLRWSSLLGSRWTSRKAPLIQLTTQLTRQPPVQLMVIKVIPLRRANKRWVK